jgi:membrane-associated protease RseP (regulator of RpoE activity)
VEALGWLIFLVALVVSVMLHETGHFVAAKRFGMKATQYFFGFGPTLWSVQRGETEYGVKALPAGGFVKIIGMTSLEDVDPQDEPRAFRRAPAWQRLIVLAAGSFMHFLFAAVLIFVVAFGIGVENITSSNTTQIGTVSACVPSSEQAILSGNTNTAGEAESPAAKAGLQVGDRVTSFGGVAVSTWTQLQNQILKARPGVPVTLTVLRDGRSLTLHTALVEVKGHGSFFGVTAATVTTFQRQNPLDAVKSVGTGFSGVVTGSVQAIGGLPAAVPSLFTQDRACSAAGNVGSVVGAAQATGNEVAAPGGWQAKVSWVLLLIASLNIFWGVFNLLPLLPMDGGHIAVVIWERIRALFARLQGRPDPGLFDYRKLIPVSFGIFAVVVIFSLLLVAADIINPVSFG